MASVLVCDKCGMSCGDVSKFMCIKAHKAVSVESHSTRCERYMDVCMDCYKEIFNIKEGK